MSFTGVNRYPRADDLKLADFDRDGDLDVVTRLGNAPTSDAAGIAVWCENLGGGARFTRHLIGKSLEYVKDIVVADFDRDGRVDIIVTEENSGKAADALACLWEHPASGATTAHWSRHTIATQYTMNRLDVADIDHDGDIDLVLAEHRGTKRIAVWENHGRGTFRERRVDQGRESHLGARLADIDGDGDLDLVSIAYDDFTGLHLGRNPGSPNRMIEGRRGSRPR